MSIYNNVSLKRLDIIVNSNLPNTYWASNLNGGYIEYKNIHIFPNSVQRYDKTKTPFSYTEFVDYTAASNAISNIDSLWFNGSKKLSVNSTGISINGTLTATGSVSSTSDILLKNVVSNIYKPLETVLQLDTFRYTPNELAKSYNVMDDKIYLGINAQQVQKYFPEVVQLAPFDSSNLPDGRIVSISGSNYLCVLYERLIPILIECIKDLKEEINILNSNI